ncbi:hook-domain-containing protein [Gigaspora margarita]|uniref:Hook-domain-containing protein n=1 Tax=Gigaspora margarita TaxID=4874 RepID=A0A8H4A541_GIGMA|nr:hook-domain-containing protein [Gigaspora margarita]
MAQSDVASALLAWVNTFDKLSHTASTVNDLADSTILTEVVCTIDNKFFKLTNDTRENSWVQRLKKLEQMHQLIMHYYETVLGVPTMNLDAPNLKSIARDGNLEETIKLWSLILTLAVRSTNNDVYIEKIQSLTPQSQQGLMVSIERIMSRLGDPTVQHHVRPSTINHDNEINKAHEEYMKLVAEKDTLAKTYSTLMEEHTELSSRYDDLQVSNDELRQRLREMESGKDLHWRAEIDKLRHDLSRSENQRHETELLVDRCNVQINDLTKKNMDLIEQADRAMILSDQVDELKHTADKLKKSEAVCEKYRKKLEETADIRRTLKAMEQENRQLVERNQMVEDEYRKVAGYKSLMENYKKQIDALQVEKAELITQNHKLEFENKHMRSKIEAYEVAHARDMETIHLLEDRVREMELGDGERLQLEEDKTEEERNIVSIGDEMSDAAKGNTMTSLRLKVIELEREIARLREGKPADGNSDAELLILQNMLEDANRAKNKLQKDYDKVQKEKISLESELRIQQNGSTSNGKSFESELTETKRKLIEAQVKLNQTEKGDELTTLESRIKELEAEKEEMKSHNDELNSLIKSLEGKSEDDLKSQNIQLLQKNKEFKKFIASQHEIIKDFDSYKTTFDAEKKAYAEEIALLKQTNEEEKRRVAKEMSLITSAWFSMGRRIQGDSVFLQRQTPSSFLGQQRALLDTQLKRR